MKIFTCASGTYFFLEELFVRFEQVELDLISLSGRFEVILEFLVLGFETFGVAHCTVERILLFHEK